MMPFSVEKHSQSASRLGLLPFLVLLCFIWKSAYWFRVDEHATDDSASDGACSAVPGSNGYSTLCMETHLFKGWEEMPHDSPEELESLLVASPSTAKKDDSAASLAPAAASRGLRGETRRAEIAPDRGASTTIKKESQRQSAFMAKASEPKPHKFSTTGLVDLQKELDAKLKLQARRHAEHRAMRALSIAAQDESSDSQKAKHLTPWAEGLLHEMHEIEDHMKHWRDERAEHAAAFATAFTASGASNSEKLAAANVSEDLLTPWAHNLDDLTHDIQHHMEERTRERAEHAAAREAAHDARIAASHARAMKAASRDISPLLQEVETLGAQLCQDPKRRHTAACSHFIHPDEDITPDAHKVDKQHKVDADAHRSLLEKHMDQLHKDQEHDDAEIRQQSETFLRELCADPSRKSYPTCVQFAPTTTLAPVRTSSNLRAAAKSPKETTSPSAPTLVEYPTSLQWTPLTDSEVSLKSHHVGDSVVAMKRKHLLGHHWVGKIPKVVCVSVLPEGKVTEVLMKYFMDNYKLQNYEGSRELVLVYHNTDAEAARIAHLYADGTSVKAAAARGNEVFPSATAYRYGAWLAKDADLVARWDFEGFHHPNRLSLQVHAIALSKRPVSVLSGVTAFDTDGKHAVVQKIGNYHGSMVGDAAWMRKNWMPILEEESSVLHGLHSGDVAQVVMPELLSYHDASMFRN